MKKHLYLTKVHLLVYVYYLQLYLPIYIPYKTLNAHLLLQIGSGHVRLKGELFHLYLLFQVSYLKPIFIIILLIPSINVC